MYPCNRQPLDVSIQLEQGHLLIRKQVATFPTEFLIHSHNDFTKNISNESSSRTTPSHSSTIRCGHRNSSRTTLISKAHRKVLQSTEICRNAKPAYMKATFFRTDRRAAIPARSIFSAYGRLLWRYGRTRKMPDPHTSKSVLKAFHSRRHFI